MVRRPNRVCQSIVQNYYVVNQLCMHDERACGYLISAMKRCAFGRWCTSANINQSDAVTRGKSSGVSLSNDDIHKEPQRVCFWHVAMCTYYICVCLLVTKGFFSVCFAGGVLRQRDHLHGRWTAFPLALQRQSQSFQQHRRRPLQRMHRPADCWRWVTFASLFSFLFSSDGILHLRLPFHLLATWGKLQLRQRAWLKSQKRLPIFEFLRWIYFICV